MTSCNLSGSWNIYHENNKIGSMSGVTDHETTIVLEGAYTRNELQREIQANQSALDASRVVIYRQELEAATGHKHLGDVLNVTITHKFAEDGKPKIVVYSGCYLKTIPSESILDNLELYQDLEFFYEHRTEETKYDN